MSLLKRIENGQTTSTGAGNGKDGNSQLGKLQSRSAQSGGVSTQRDTYSDLKSRVQNRLLAELDPTMDVTRVGEVRNTIQDLFEQVLAEENIVLTRQERHRLFEQIAAEILGLGPLQPLLEDGSITEIMVNGAKNVY
ncbi:MAG: CpaF family protein, partial [Anaerolineales bacterium]|nr:CpaF family protein [Anaerolineales bacterium]